MLKSALVDGNIVVPTKQHKKVKYTGLLFLCFLCDVLFLGEHICWILLIRGNKIRLYHSCVRVLTGNWEEMRHRYDKNKFAFTRNFDNKNTHNIVCRISLPLACIL